MLVKRTQINDRHRTVRAATGLTVPSIYKQPPVRRARLSEKVWQTPPPQDTAPWIMFAVYADGIAKPVAGYRSLQDAEEELHHENNAFIWYLPFGCKANRN